MPVKVVNWNVLWAKPRTPQGSAIRQRTRFHAPEIVCRTATDAGLRDEFGGHASAARPDCRFISGVTQTSIGPVQVIGAGIP